MSLFCRHNRFVADCPICAKGTVLDPDLKATRSRPSRTGSARKSAAGPRSGSPGPARVSRGVYATAGPYEDGREVRLEKVPGGLRLAAWEAGRLVRGAPVIAVGDLARLLSEAVEKDVIGPLELDLEARDAPAFGEHGASPGRTGELQEELRVERLDDERLRIARWILRPNRGWELQETPVMLPAGRFVGALRAAAGRGVLAPA